EYDLCLVRYLANGRLDSSFGQKGKVVADLGGDDIVTKSIISENALYVAGAIRQLTSYASLASLVLKVPVQLSCPSNVVSGPAKNSCTAVVSNIDPILTPQGADAIVNYKLSGATTGTGRGSASGRTFNKGVTTVTYALDEDPAKTCSFTVTVSDTEPPKISGLSVNPTILWPADHKMKDVVVSYTSTDNCGVASNSISISCNENLGILGAGNTLSDWEIVNEHLVRLRAERSGLGNGRIYTIKVTCTDNSGNATTQTATVTVPKSNSSNATLQAPYNPHSAQEEETAENKLNVKVFSNPSSTYFTLLISGAERGKNASLRVIDASGKLVEMRQTILPDQPIQIGNSYKQGTYFIEVMQSNKRAQVKVIKQ
ncbi:MAG: T9SS type A sorting domain-containing protein, partial [Bacteroidota bacterium]|nr:T9SS type A sorting domain-containing protein [Bacteroidota bacterium]